jgi:dipeptidyl-peptidase 4
MADESYPRQKARTRSFQLGRPRSFTVLDDGRVLFLRSASGSTAVNDLWLIDTAEHCLVDVATLTTSSSELPAAERARRERLREVTSGITSYSVDDAGTTAVFTVDGHGFSVDLHPPFTVTTLPLPEGIVDLRISPCGQHIAFVHHGSLMRMAIDGAQPQVVRSPAHAHETWGLPDFIAAEELERIRGYWWLGQSLLAARVDDSEVQQWWISDPATPGEAPTSHRYPSAGTQNAVVELWLIHPDGTAHQLDRDQQAWPYVASVHVQHGTIVSYLSRDQKAMRIDVIDAHTGAAQTLRTLTDPCWVDVHAGVPALDHAGNMITIEPIDGVNRLCCNGQAVSPEDWQVTGLIHASANGYVIGVQTDATSHAMARITIDQAELLTPAHGWSSGVARGHTYVTVVTSLDTDQPRFTVHQEHSTTIDVPTHAEVPCITSRPILLDVTERSLPAAVLLPNNFDGQALPVIMSPYGGPHAQRVVQSRNAYATEQWIADHGYAVVIVDGAGTPGRGPINERLVMHDLAHPVVNDQVDALQALAKQYPVMDLSRVGIRGWSFGGYLAALAVLTRPDVFHAAVAGAPVTDWRLYDTAYTERYLGDPRIDEAPYVRTDLITKADQLTRPLLLIHGLADDNVVAAHTLQLSRALLEAGKDHDVLPLSGITHMTPQEVVAENLLLREMSFFDQHLRGL